MSRILSVILLIGCVTIGFSQKFLDEIHSEVTAKKNEKAIASSQAFKDFWESGQLSAEHKKRFVELIVEFKKNRYQPIPHYVNNMDIIRYSITKRNLAGPDLDSLFSMLKQIVAKIPKGRQLNSTYKYLATFMETDTLYDGNKHQVSVTGGDFKIYFVAAPPIEEEPIEEEPEVEEEEEFASDDDFDSEEAWDSWDEETVEDEWGTTDDEESGEVDEDINESVLDVVYEAAYIPNAEGPVIEFTNVNLNIHSNVDSVVSLKNTSFKFQLTNGNAIGEGGKFSWESVGLSPDVNVDFTKYVFDVSKSVIEAEAVTLNYETKLEAPVEGIFNYSVESVRDTLKKKYPRFMSYKSNVKITDLGENIKYNGGFSLNGRNIHSSSVSGGKCDVIVSLNDTAKFKAVARDFSITDSTIAGYPVKISVYENQDSIFHPGVRLFYNRSSQDLKLYKNKSSFKSSPFKDSYHKIEILADAVYWNLDDSLMSFSNISAKNEVPAFFDSYDNFQLKRYAQLQGLYPFHPLQMAMNYSRQTKKTEFYADDLSTKYKQKSGTVRSAMAGLMQAGYIDFDPKTGLIKIKPKTKHYYESRRNKTDYDYFSIRSIAPDGANGVLNINNSDLRINGIDEFVISDSLNISIFPKERYIILQENRNFIVDGLITTNNYRFNGSGFVYNHERYDIKLENIDSIEFFVDVRDSLTGEVIDKKVLDNKLTYSSGTLTMDDPLNKACKKRNPKYPHFNANKGASLFFTGKEVLNGAYDSSIYYKIPPFDVDSLSGDLSSVSFDGTFITGGIFPDFEQKMDVQKDLSFGFSKDIPEEGWPIYGGKGRFFGGISMNSKGLRGNGRIVIMGTQIESEDFVFYPDSVEAIGEKAFTINTEQSGQSMADMSVTDYEMKWVVSKDSLALTSYSSPISLYDSLAKLNGTVVISTEKGMKGLGLLETSGSLTISQNIALRKNDYEGRNSQFEILSDQDGKPALRSDMVRVKMNIKEGKARFNPEEKGVATNEFPYMKYKTSIDDGVWDMNARTVTMSMPEGGDLSKSYFYSTRKRQDSLVFNAEKAIYYMDSLKMHISGVPEVRVVDAQVIPKGGALVIGENAEMDTLYDCVVLLDTATHYHRLFDGQIKIKTKNDFEGRAVYEFVNFEKDTLNIAFSKFDLFERQESKRLSSLHTRAKGIVSEDEQFMIAPKIQYKGEAVMESDKRNLDLDGYVKLNLEGQEASDWIKYVRTDTLDEVRINLDDVNTGKKKNKKDKSNDLEEGTDDFEDDDYDDVDESVQDGKFSGILLSRSTEEIYSVIVGQKKSENDFVIFHAENMLTYDFASEEFEVSTEARLHNEEYVGNFLAYNENNKTFRYSGGYKFLELGTQDLGNIDVKFSGFGHSDIEKGFYTTEGVGYIYFEAPEIDALGKHISEAVQLLSLPQGLVTNDSLYVNIANLSDNKSAESFKKNSEKGYTPLYKEVKGMESSIGFSHLALEWNAEQKSWYSVGQIGVSNIGKNDVSTYLNGYVEIKNTRFGPEVNVYLEVSANVWCFFSYGQTALLASSSLQEFNETIESKSEMAKNEAKEEYYFALADVSDKNNYMRHHVNDYLGGNSLVPRALPTKDQDYEEEVDDFDDESFDDDSSLIEDDEEFEVESNKKKDKKKKKGKDKGIEDEFEPEGDEFEVEDEISNDDMDSLEEDEEFEVESNKKKDKKKKKGKDKDIEDEFEPEGDEFEVEDEISNDVMDSLEDDEEFDVESTKKKDKKKKGKEKDIEDDFESKDSDVEEEKSGIESSTGKDKGQETADEISNTNGNVETPVTDEQQETIIQEETKPEVVPEAVIEQENAVVPVLPQETVEKNEESESIDPIEPEIDDGEGENSSKKEKKKKDKKKDKEDQNEENDASLSVEEDNLEEEPEEIKVEKKKEKKKKNKKGDSSEELIEVEE